MKRVLFIAYHFPPIGQSSGYLRTLKFAEYLPALGYEPAVLTVHPRAYPSVTDRAPAVGLEATRAFALDAARHLSILGRYPGRLARPDRWASWIPFGVMAGRKLIRRFEPHVIMSTFPIASAHVIGMKLAKATGIPWVADFRDPMTEPGYPSDAGERARLAALERNIASAASVCTFTTSATRDMYRDRYVELDASRFVLIPNGYDEEDFANLETHSDCPVTGPVRVVHSGTIYPSERDPRALIRALGTLKREGAIDGGNFSLRLRATGHDELIAGLVRASGVSELIEIVPSIPYADALQEMMLSDALLVLQASNCNRQVPAKLYEYLRSGRPILALTDPAGATSKALSETGNPYQAPLDDEERIAAAIRRLIGDLRSGTITAVDREYVTQHSRRRLTDKLSRIFDTLVSN